MVAVDLLTGDEIKEALVRFVLTRKGKEVPPEGINAEVSYRNVRLPDGTVALFASIAVVTAAGEPEAEAGGNG